jgi:hypothetical protein
MRTVVIKTIDGRHVATLVQQAEHNDRDFEEVVMALILTLANHTGLQLTTENIN